MNIAKNLLDKISHFAGTKTARRVVLGVFLLQAIFLAFAMHIGTPPDENNHIEFIEYYAHHSLSPILSDQQPTWSLGDKTREVDYLYHYGSSLISRVLPGEQLDVYVLRLLSVLAAFATLVLLARLLKRLGVSASATTVALAIISNLPMVLMVSAAVNNDVFVWLGYILLLLLVLRLWQKPTATDVLWLLTLAAAGGLVKRTMLPVGVIIVVVAAVLVAKKWKTFKSTLTFDWRLIIAAVALLVSSILFVERVGGNLYEYGKVTPSCEQVQGEDACSIFWSNKRKKWLDAGSPADQNIWLPAGTKPDATAQSIVTFGPEWLVVSVNNIVDIQTQGWGHKVTPPVWLAPALLVLLIVVTVYGVVRDLQLWRKGRSAALQRLFVVLTALFIIGVHMWVNYTIYLPYRVFGLALNGRYILPALLVLIGLGCYYGSLMLPRRARQLTALVTIVCVVLLSGIVMMLRNTQLVTG